MTPKFSSVVWGAVIAFAALWSSQAFPLADVAKTKHNLSISGPGGIKATTETEICVFCHVPHLASNLGALWNRRNPNGTPSYTPYASSTTKGTDRKSVV